VQQFQAFLCKFVEQEAHARGIAARPVQAGNAGHRVQVNGEASRGFGADIAGPKRLVCAVA
jgi:hypothetical protein